mgnify:CR=1 FL=1
MMQSIFHIKVIFCPIKPQKYIIDIFNFLIEAGRQKDENQYSYSNKMRHIYIDL